MRLISPRWLAVGLALLIWAVFSMSGKASAETGASYDFNQRLGIVR